MEHIIVKELSGGYVKLTAADGYRLFSKSLRRVISEAVVKAEDIGNFTAIGLE